MTEYPSKAVALNLSSLPSPVASVDGLRRYLQEIARFPILTPKEEFELAKRWKEQEDIAAAHRLVTSHLRLVAKIAMRYRGYGLPVGELIAEGNIGLMQAVKRFEPDKGFKLATYAIWWIKAAIQEYVLRSWTMVKVGSSAAQKRLFFNLRKMKKKIGTAHQLEITDEHVAEIAAALDVSKEDVIDMDRRMTANDVYLNSPVTNADGNTDEKMDFLADTADNQETTLANREEMQQRRALLVTALKTLNAREREIILKRKLQDEPATLEELSQQYNISRERIRQIEVKAFEKLQKAMVG